MPIPVDTLRAAASRPRTKVLRASTLTEAKRLGTTTAFLCHSHLDATLAKGLVGMFIDDGGQLYVDWLDTEMPDTPDRTTALRIQSKIVDLTYFIFLATSNSMRSRWCPWEIGYANGVKELNRIVVVPTQEGTTTYGNEYLQLYRRIDLSSLGRLGAWEPGETQNGVLLENF